MKGRQTVKEASVPLKLILVVTVVFASPLETGLEQEKEIFYVNTLCCHILRPSQSYERHKK